MTEELKKLSIKTLKESIIPGLRKKSKDRQAFFERELLKQELKKFEPSPKLEELDLPKGHKGFGCD